MQPDSETPLPVIGHLAEATATVLAIAPSGTRRLLAAGDSLYLNDRVHIEPGQNGAILLLNGEMLQLDGSSGLELDESMLPAPDSDTPNPDNSMPEEQPDSTFTEDLSFEDEVYQGEPFTIDLLISHPEEHLAETVFVQNLNRVAGNESGVRMAMDTTALIVDPKAYRWLSEKETETLIYGYEITGLSEPVKQEALITLQGTHSEPRVIRAEIRSGHEASDKKLFDCLRQFTGSDQSDAQESL